MGANWPKFQGGEQTPKDNYQVCEFALRLNTQPSFATVQQMKVYDKTRFNSQNCPIG